MGTAIACGYVYDAESVIAIAVVVIVEVYRAVYCVIKDLAESKTVLMGLNGVLLN